MDDIQVTDAGGWPLELCRLPLICVYDHPSDYPDSYVARLWEGKRNSTDYISISGSMEKIRSTMPQNMIRIPGDDPLIVEYWV